VQIDDCPRRTCAVRRLWKRRGLRKRGARGVLRVPGAVRPTCHQQYPNHGLERCWAVGAAGETYDSVWPGLSCEVGFWCPSGTCVPYLPAAHGEACNPTEVGCREIGDLCSEVSRTCVSVPLEGDPCDLYTCVWYMQCDFATSTCVKFIPP